MTSEERRRHIVESVEDLFNSFICQHDEVENLTLQMDAMLEMLYEIAYWQGWHERKEQEFEDQVSSQISKLKEE